ncbi:hypothetical protein [Leptospira bouyouniensis]|uniref:Uncharacterized protein n=1 Tax=Leptospira bouyouniensis TaxID=2484911 RepID=A0ABY2L2C2_9LEPT|nr:hypothetical protein [Leptospira bouyouniensis]TGK45932.1 hypothetical protein EHQ10_18700 [Leptospira bouyouniensis]
MPIGILNKTTLKKEIKDFPVLSIVMPTQSSTFDSISRIQSNKSNYTSTDHYQRELNSQVQVNALNTLIMEFDRVRIEFRNTYYPLQFTFASTSISSESPMRFDFISEILKKSLRDFENIFFGNKSGKLYFPRLIWKGTGTDAKSTGSMERRRDHFHVVILLPLCIDLIPLLQSILIRNYESISTKYRHRSLPEIKIDPVGHPVRGSIRNFSYYLARKEGENPTFGLEKIEWDFSSPYGIIQRNTQPSRVQTMHNTISDCELGSIVLSHIQALDKFKTKLATPGRIHPEFSNLGIDNPAPFEPAVKRINQADDSVNMSEARDDSKNLYANAINSQDTNVHLIIAATGIGKSYLINKTPEYITRDGRIMIVSPRHNTIAEYTIGEKLPDIPRDLKDLFKRAHEKKISPRKALRSLDFSTERKLQLRLYLDAYEKEERRILKDSPIVLVTHARFLCMTSTQIAKFGTVIVDEDIVAPLLSPKTVSISQIQKLIQDIESTPVLLIKDIEARKKIIENLNVFLNSTENIPHDSPHFTQEMLKIANLEINLSAINAMEELIENKEPTLDHLQSGLSGILKSKVFQKLGDEIQFILNFHFPRNIKTIILTATPSLEAYKALFGDRLVVHKVKQPKLLSKIIQDTSESFSLFRLKNFKIFQHYNNLILALVDKGFKIISYKGKHPLLSNHFGATTSDNSLENQNLGILGTNNINPDTFRLQCAYLGWDHSSIKTYDEALKSEDEQSKYVTFNGYSFQFLTLSTDPKIIQFQLELVSAELIQAVGRARPYQFTVTIYIYGRMPFPGAFFL